MSPSSKKRKYDESCSSPRPVSAEDVDECSIKRQRTAEACKASQLRQSSLTTPPLSPQKTSTTYASAILRILEEDVPVSAPADAPGPQTPTSWDEITVSPRARSPTRSPLQDSPLSRRSFVCENDYDPDFGERVQKAYTRNRIAQGFRRSMYGAAVADTWKRGSTPEEARKEWEGRLQSWNRQDNLSQTPEVEDSGHRALLEDNKVEQDTT
nr:hypothetical protein CFP56_69103 [Quercus suber]